jgi:hypothetical protein
MSFLRFLELTAIISLNSVNQLNFLTVKCGVFFAVRTESLNFTRMSFGFKGLRLMREKYMAVDVTSLQNNSVFD